MALFSLRSFGSHDSNICMTKDFQTHPLFFLFFFFLSHCSEVALVLYIWHLVTVTLIWFDFYLTTEPMSICRHVGELAPSILPPDLDIQLLSNSYLIKVIVMALWFLFLAFVLQCYQLWRACLRPNGKWGLFETCSDVILVMYLMVTYESFKHTIMLL